MARGLFSAVLGESAGPGHLIRIDVHDSGLSVHGGAAPLGTTVEARKNYRILPDAERNELPFTAELLEFFHCPLMCFRRAHGQKILGEKLARKGSGASGERLLEGGNFAGQRARRIFSGLDRKSVV